MLSWHDVYMHDKVNRARNLYLENVSSFYHNVQTLYGEYNYSTNHIWNYDELGVQARRNGGSILVFVQYKSKTVHSIILDKREWLSVLITCLNVAGQYIPHFFIFKGKHMCRNYIEHCEPNSTMAVGEKA